MTKYSVMLHAQKLCTDKIIYDIIVLLRIKRVSVMEFIFKKDQLVELMYNFYTLTKIRIVIFDTEFNKVAAYPENECDVCSKIKQRKNGQFLCAQSDREACMICAQKNTLHIYKCHAGLIEAVSPLKMNDITLGYIMFGQIVEKRDKKINKDKITDYISSYINENDDAEKLFSTLVSKSDKQIGAAAKIMESCACYLCVKELVKVDSGDLIFLLDNYINNNIKEDLSARHLCEKFGISKNKLYRISNNIYGTGIADYIRKKRIHLAQNYLRQGCSVAEAAEKTGFYDYNYFSKVYKRETGMLPSKSR